MNLERGIEDAFYLSNLLFRASKRDLVRTIDTAVPGRSVRILKRTTDYGGGR